MEKSASQERPTLCGNRPRAPPDGAAEEPAHWKRHPDSEQGPSLLRWYVPPTWLPSSWDELRTQLGHWTGGHSETSYSWIGHCRGPYRARLSNKATPSKPASLLPCSVFSIPLILSDDVNLVVILLTLEKREKLQAATWPPISQENPEMSENFWHLDGWIFIWQKVPKSHKNERNVHGNK